MDSEVSDLVVLSICQRLPNFENQHRKLFVVQQQSHLIATFEHHYYIPELSALGDVDAPVHIAELLHTFLLEPRGHH